MKIEYFYGIPSPFTYLGSLKFQSIAKKYNAEIIEKPCDLVGGIFSKKANFPTIKLPAQNNVAQTNIIYALVFCMN